MKNIHFTDVYNSKKAF